MNILTKISIVVLVVLVLLASAVFINLATSGPNYRDAYLAEKVAKNTAELMANQKELALQRAIAELKAKTDECSQRLAEIATVRQALEAKIQEAEIKILDLTRQVNDAQSQIKLLGATGKANADQATLFYNQYEKTRKDLINKESEFRDLSQKFQETEAALKRQEKLVFIINEDKNELLGQLAKVRPTAGPAAVGTGTAAQTPATEYTGTITTVRNGLASINIGSANGVKIGDQLIIYRGDKFIGNLKIELVNANDAAGTILNKSSTSDPAQGDKVASKISITDNPGNM